MKRYKKLATQIPQLGNTGCGTVEMGSIEVENEMVEDPDGDWVKREDINKEMHEAYIKGLNCRTIDVSMMEVWCKQHGISKGCNCEEMANKPNYETHPDGLSPLPILLAPFWICPAHGYKRR